MGGVTWTVSERLPLPLQLAPPVQVERVGTVVLAVGGVPTVEHVVGADVDEEGAAGSCNQTFYMLHTDTEPTQ